MTHCIDCHQQKKADKGDRCQSCAQKQASASGAKKSPWRKWRPKPESRIAITPRDGNYVN